MSSFTITAGPSTDIWKKPPTTNRWNAPFKPAATKPLSEFRSATITFQAKWTQQYDQAGLLLTLEPREGDEAAKASARKWVKTGIEYYNGVEQLSTVACDRYADWSIAPLTALGGKPGDAVTMTVVREKDEMGNSIWVYYEPPAGQGKAALREVAWFFEPNGQDAAGWDLTVSAFTCRPEGKTEESLTTEFSGFDVKWHA